MPLGCLLSLTVAIIHYAATPKANITMQSGLASSLAFFIFPNVSETVMSWFVLVSAVLGLFGYLTLINQTNREAYQRGLDERQELLHEEGAIAPIEDRMGARTPIQG
jgi:hypothetical protein